MDRYLFRELLIPLGYCLGGFLVFWIAFDLFGELEDFQKLGMSASEIVEYYWVKLPELLVKVMPVALLLAMLYALTTHARHNELIAFRAAGVSLWRLCVPYFVIGSIFSLILFYLNETWAAESADAAESIQQRHAADADHAWQRPLNFANHSENRIWHIEAYNWETTEMINPHVDWRLPDGPKLVLIAERGIWTNDAWVFFNARQFTFDPESNELLGSPKTYAKPTYFDHFVETPEHLKSEIKISQVSNKKLFKEARLSIREIKNYIRLHPDLPDTDRARLYTQYQGRFAWPLTCLVVVLVSIPFGAASERRNVFVGVASSIFICFFYFVLLRFGLALGTGGKVPPWVGAWLPNALFGGIGIWLMTRVR